MNAFNNCTHTGVLLILEICLNELLLKVMADRRLEHKKSKCDTRKSTCGSTQAIFTNPNPPCLACCPRSSLHQAIITHSSFSISCYPMKDEQFAPKNRWRRINLIRHSSHHWPPHSQCCSQAPLSSSVTSTVILLCLLNSHLDLFSLSIRSCTSHNFNTARTALQ